MSQKWCSSHVNAPMGVDVTKLIEKDFLLFFIFFGGGEEICAISWIVWWLCEGYWIVFLWDVFLVFSCAVTIVLMKWSAKIYVSLFINLNDINDNIVNL